MVLDLLRLAVAFGAVALLGVAVVLLFTAPRFPSTTPASDGAPVPATTSTAGGAA